MANVNIHGGTFNSLTVQGDFQINNRDSGLHTLRLGVSLGAIHDSAERYPPPKCHPDTRKAVRQIILDWISNESSSSSFFWLYGPAGAGKTAILQAIAEFLSSPSESGQNFGGSFFFSRGKQGRDQGHFLFSTIAYQLALKVPGLRQHVNHIMELDPTLHTKSMDVQLQTLIVDAFRYLSPLPQRSYLVIIDGLDECHDKVTQQSILQLLCETITVHKLPLRFLIGSRPECHIRSSFDRESLCTIAHRVVLDETFNPGRDIRVFLQDSFAKIRAENFILSHVERPWPSEGIIDLLVQRSSGQFIYAATVVKFVGADFCSPTKQLELVLRPDPTAFSDLDQLYTQILSVYPSAVNIVQVLGIIITCHGICAKAIEDIFQMEEGELRPVLRGLSSLMDGNGKCLNKGREFITYSIPHFAHASFRDYLLDPSRSGPFHVNRQEYENQVTIRSFALIIQSIRFGKMSSITQVLHTTTWEYLILRLPHRFIRSPNVVKEVVMTDINDLVQEFWRTSSDGAVGASFFAMRCLFEILQECLDDLEKSNCIDKHYSTQSDLASDHRIRAKFTILFDGYRKMFDQSFSKSKDLGDMLRFLPGIVVQKPMSMQGMSDLYRVNPDLLERFIKSTIDPLRPLRAFPNSRYTLDDYLSGFLQDRERSRLRYCDPMLQHISICRRLLSFLDGSNAFDLPSQELSDYIYLHFYDHLCEATSIFLCAQDISEDHPAVEILHDLETTAYYVDENSSGHILAQYIIQTILKWANMLNSRLKGVGVSASNVNLKERVCHLTNKIYREILFITSREGITCITLSGLDHVQVSALSWSLQYSFIRPLDLSSWMEYSGRSSQSRSSQYSIVLPWDLLSWISVEDGIPCSFANFITTPELSGPLYISPDIYHTQITEYSLQTIYQYYHISRFRSCSLNLDRSFREHLSRALPTEMIFHFLRSIPSEHLIRGYHIEMLDTLEIIIKWLQGLDPELPTLGYMCDLFQGELLRYKALSTNFDF